jgi:hypothetical protein
VEFFFAFTNYPEHLNQSSLLIQKAENASLSFPETQERRKRLAQSSRNTGKLKTPRSTFPRFRKGENASLSLPETQERRKRLAQSSGNSGKAKMPRSAFLKLGKVENASLSTKITTSNLSRIFIGI